MADTLPQRQAEALILVKQFKVIELSSLDPSRPRKSARVYVPDAPPVLINGATWIALKQKDYVQADSWKPNEIGFVISKKGEAALQAWKDQNDVKSA